MTTLDLDALEAEALAAVESYDKKACHTGWVPELSEYVSVATAPYRRELTAARARIAELEATLKEHVKALQSPAAPPVS